MNLTPLLPVSLNLVLSLTGVPGTAAGPFPRAVRLSFADEEAWIVETSGPYWAHIDRRALFNAFHPLVPSTDGAFAAATRSIPIPSAWRPPLVLRFYHTDDYQIPTAPPPDPAKAPACFGASDFPGHRFKQVLIDGRVVWEQDVSGLEGREQEPIRPIDVTPWVKPGTTASITFRVFDKVSTWRRLEGDLWYEDELGKEEEPRFHTAVFFGSAVLGEKPAVERTPEERRPSEQAVLIRHHQRWPLPLPGEPQSSPATLALVAPQRIPRGGFPLACTVPFGPGSVGDEGAVELLDPQGCSVAVQPEIVCRWPDGSIRWLLLNAVLPARAAPGKSWRLRFGDDGEGQPRRSLHRVRVDQRGSRVIIDTGRITVALGGDRQTLIDSVVLRDGPEPVVQEVKPRMVVDGEDLPGEVRWSWKDLRILRSGPVRATVEMQGLLQAENQGIGRFVWRLDAYAGLGVLSAQLRIFNDVEPQPHSGTVDDPSLPIRDLSLSVPMLGHPRGPVLLGIEGHPPMVAGDRPVDLVQESGDRLVISGQTPEGAKRAAGWAAASTERGALQAMVWRFWPQYPKAFTVTSEGLTVKLFCPSPGMDRYRPRFGEAKRHDLLLVFSEEMASERDLESFAENFQHPPRLFDREWFCRSGGLAEMDPHWFDRQPKIAEWVAQTYGNATLEDHHRHGYGLGIRDFADAPMGPPEARMWRSDYCARVEGAFNWALAGGSPEFFERAVEIARHIQDIDAVHLPPGHPRGPRALARLVKRKQTLSQPMAEEWEGWHGLTITSGRDHSVHGGFWQRNAAYQAGEALLANWWLTGDPDSRDAGLANADYLLVDDWGLKMMSARVQTRPLWIFTRAWEATGDRKYLRGVRRYLEFLSEEVLDWRRGAYINPPTRNYATIEAGLSSDLGVHLYEYYRLTGDVLAAQMVVALAEAVICESMLPQPEALGDFIFFPRYARSSWYFAGIAWLLCCAYDLTEQADYLRAARTAFDRYLLGSYYQSYGNWGWLEPRLGHWFEKFADVETPPYTITTMVTEPDPAHYAHAFRD